LILLLIVNTDNGLLVLKTEFCQRQIKAAITVNTELLMLYWELGAMIVEKQEKSTWGDGLLLQLSNDLQKEFPDIKGFSETNLRYIKRWYLFYDFSSNQPVKDEQLKDTKQIQPQLVAEKKDVKLNSIRPQLVAKTMPKYLASIPWGHNREIISKCKDITEALYYVRSTITCNWSRSVLLHQIESGLYERDGKSVNNFPDTLQGSQLTKEFPIELRNSLPTIEELEKELE
jgi:predicted nuclease of restriction endonuclease-like (RecB) superfamily